MSIFNSIRIFDADGKFILFSESEKTATLEICLGAEKIEISRDDWRKLHQRIPDYYNSGQHFDWVLPTRPAAREEPEQPPASISNEKPDQFCLDRSLDDLPL